MVLESRAELRQVPSNGSSGSTVIIHLSSEVINEMLQLPEKLPTLIPMLDVQVQLDINGIFQTISPKWVLQLDTVAFKNWTRESSSVLAKNTYIPKRRDRGDFAYYNYRFREPENKCTSELELKQWPAGTPEYCEDGVRLLADSSGLSVLCLRGFSLEVIRTPGFIGVINSNSTTPDAARGRSLDFEAKSLLDRAISHTRVAISKNLTQRKNNGFIPDQIEFIAWCVSVYGYEVLKESAFPWIQIVAASGDSRYLSSSELTEMLIDIDSIYLGINLGPISVSKRWRSQTQLPFRRELGICFSEASPGYVSVPKYGKLDELWSDFDSKALFQSFLKTVSDSWRTSIPELLSNTEMTHTSNELCGFLSRPMPAVA